VSPGAPTNASLIQFLLTINDKIGGLLIKNSEPILVLSIIQSPLILAPLSSHISTALILPALYVGETYDTLI
jgi:hypothetical protein